MRAKHATMNSAEVQVDRCQVDSEHVITAAGLGPGPQPAGLDAPVGGQQQVRDATQQAAVAARHAHAHTHVDPVLADGWSELHYVQVAVKGLTETICALCDSGTQLCCVDASVIEPLNLPRLGHVMLRGLSTDLVRADLVCLHVKLLKANEFLPVTCAVCDNLNAPMLLGTDVIDRLFAHSLTEASGEIHGDDNDDDCVSDCVDGQIVCDEVTVDSNSDANVVNVDDAAKFQDECDKQDECDSLSDLPASDERSVAAATLIVEQQDDKSLDICRSLADRGKAGYYFDNGILYRHERILGQDYEQLCLPKTRHVQAMRLVHAVYGGHLASKKTKARLKLSFTWPTIAIDVQKFCEACHECQKRRRVTAYDRVPIVPIPRHESVFQVWVMDCLGLLFPNQNVKYNYALVLCDSCSRLPVAFALTSLTAKNVCKALLQLFQFTGIPSVRQSDMASNFNCQLNKTFLSMLGCTLRFIVPGRPQQSGLCERLIGTLKNMVSKVAIEHPKSWHQHLGYILWALRECPHETTGG